MLPARRSTTHLASPFLAREAHPEERRARRIMAPHLGGGPLGLALSQPQGPGTDGCCSSGRQIMQIAASRDAPRPRKRASLAARSLGLGSAGQPASRWTHLLRAGRQIIDRAATSHRLALASVIGLHYLFALLIFGPPEQRARTHSRWGAAPFASCGPQAAEWSGCSRWGLANAY